MKMKFIIHFILIIQAIVIGLSAKYLYKLFQEIEINHIIT